MCPLRRRTWRLYSRSFIDDQQAASLRSAWRASALSTKDSLLNAGIISKAIRETAAVTVAIGIGLGLMEVLFILSLSTFSQEMADSFLQIPFVRRMMAAFLGIESADTLGPMMIMSIAWVHPVVLSLLFAHCVIVCTRIPAGEIDRGTVDVLLSLPVTRRAVYLSETTVWMLAGLLITAIAALANICTTLWLHLDYAGLMSRRLLVGLNLYALYLAAGGIAWFASSICDRRGRAIAIAFGVLVSSLLLNVLAGFNATVKALSVVSILKYYRPVFIIQGTADTGLDIAVLLAVGFVFWLAGLVIFARRDIRTV